MLKYLFLFCLLLFNGFCFGQLFQLTQNIDSIPLYENNRKFVSTVNKEFKKLVKENVDSILLYYPIDYTSNYAMIFWKKGTLTQSVAFSQNYPPKQRVSKEILQNKVLNGVNIKSLYDVLQNNQARTIDTTFFISENNPIYCQFYFDKKIELTAGYRGWVLRPMDHSFINAVANEQARIAKKDL